MGIQLVPHTYISPPTTRLVTVSGLHVRQNFLLFHTTFNQKIHGFITHFVSSNGDSHVMEVSTFATDVSHLGIIGYPITTTHIYFTAYYTPSNRQWVTCQVEFITRP